jgi:hypothetical protein
MTVEINALLSDLDANEDLPQKWSVKPVEDAVPVGKHVAATTLDKRHEILRGLPVTATPVFVEPCDTLDPFL